MSKLSANIEQLIEAEKVLTFRPKWDSKRDPRHFHMAVPLTTGEVTVGGFELRARVSKQIIDRGAMLQLQYAVTGRDQIPLWRCQWRPFETHTNEGWGPPGFEYHEFIGTSHQHTFADNYIRSENRMRSGLKGAVPINPDPTTLSDFLDFCGKCFKIKNINLIEVPEISPELFWMPNG